MNNAENTVYILRSVHVYDEGNKGGIRDEKSIANYRVVITCYF